MKQLLKFSLAVVLLMAFSSCNRVTVGGDEEGVLIMKPWFFGHGGVDEDPVTSGSENCAPSTDEVVFKITPIAYGEKFENLISDDNVPLDFETHLTLQISKGTTPELYKKFGDAWYFNNVSPKFRSLVRDKISSYKMQDLISKREVLTGIDSSLNHQLTKYFREIGLDVNIIQVTIGAATPPQEVLDETQKTAAQNQSILTQNARKLAEDSRRAAEVSKAVADKAYKSEMNMNMDEYLKLRQLEIEAEKLVIVKGKQNVSIIMGNAQPMFNVK